MELYGELALGLIPYSKPLILGIFMPITLLDNTIGSISNVAGATVGSSSASGDQWIYSKTTGNNQLVGGSGNDIIVGSGSSNLMTGGAGKDVFTLFYRPAGYQTITDFASGDIIVLTNVGYSDSNRTAIHDLKGMYGSSGFGGLVSNMTYGDVGYFVGNWTLSPAGSNAALGVTGRPTVSATLLTIRDDVENPMIILENVNVGSNLRYTNHGGYVKPNGFTEDTFLYLYSGSTAISGAAIGGNQLTAVITDNTFLTNAPTSGITYRWYADSVLVSTSALDDRYFTLPLSLLGKQITVSASYTDGYGNAETSALSTASSAVNGLYAYASTVSANLDYLQANRVALASATINIYDGSNTAVNATIAQLTTAADAITLIRSHSDSGGNYLVGVADTAANISAGISTLVANASILSDLSITDDGIVQLSSSQVSSLVSLAGSYGVDLTGYTFDSSILVNQATDGTLYIKAGGSLSTCASGGLAFFNGAFSNTDGIYANASTIVPLFASSGGINGYTLPDLYTGPASLGLTYQLIEAAQNAVVTGSTSSEFIKVSNSNSIGKAVNGNGGNDVIDGGVGSTFVTGGDNHNTTFFLDGRAPGTSWSTITDFQAGVDKATIWGFVRGVSSIDTSFTNYNNEGAAGYQGLTLHFKNLLPDGQTSGSNANLNSITFTGYTLQDLGVNSLAELNAQINAGTNPNILVGSTQDSAGTHSYLYIC